MEVKSHDNGLKIICMNLHRIFPCQKNVCDRAYHFSLGLQLPLDFSFAEGQPLKYELK